MYQAPGLEPQVVGGMLMIDDGMVKSGSEMSGDGEELDDGAVDQEAEQECCRVWGIGCKVAVV